MRAVYTPCEAGPTGFSHHCDAPVPFGLTPSICFAAEPVTQKEIMTDTHILFQPVEFDNLSLKNRIVMAPMTRSFSPGNVPGEDVAAYYRRRAEGEVGLILTEGVSTNETTATGTPNVPNIVTDAAKAGWKKVVEGVHEAGGKIGIQLWHEGPFRNPKNTSHPDVPSWSASGVKTADKQLWNPMSESEIETAITEFVDAAVAAKDLGCSLGFT